SVIHFACGKFPKTPLILQDCRLVPVRRDTGELRICQKMSTSLALLNRCKLSWSEERERDAAMTKDDIQLLYKYDRWANNRVLQAASALSAEEFARDLGGSFRSVRDTLVHIIGGE